MSPLHLAQRYLAGAGRNGGFRFDLWNLGHDPVRAARLCYNSTTMPLDEASLSRGRLARVLATHVEIAFDPPEEIAPGSALTLELSGLTHPPTNRTQGAMSAWIVTPDGREVRADTGDLEPPDGAARGPVKDWPQGRAADLGLLPWPASVEVEALGAAPSLVPGRGADAAPFARVAALHRRLFPAAPAPISPGGAGREVIPVRGPQGAGAYALRFAETIVLEHGDADGLRHGLVTLAQMAHAARVHAGFRFPVSGVIEDAPRHSWRGCHLDVARNIRTPGEVMRLLDVLAWHKMSRFHWHLTDDEGYRIPSRAFPALNDTGSRRGRNAPLPPQYADGPKGQRGAYSEADIARIVGHAAALGIEVVPEIDLPGHATALLDAIPGLRDPGEPQDSYRSIQGYPNNALNPALPRTYEVVGTLLDEICALFPGEVIHVGGDEVDAGSWHRSPAANALSATIGASGAAPLQSHFMRRVQEMVRARGRVMACWDECALGGGVSPERTILMAWRTPEITARLVAEGYDVVATPGQAYYLDMVQGGGWDAAGTSWAGPVPPERSYAYEAADRLPDGPGRLIGVQAGIWSEHLRDMARLRDMVHPRLSAVAEAAWTPGPAKDWDRFAAHARLMPAP